METVSFGAPTGPLGIVHRASEARQPYYDALGRSAVYPAYHVVAGLTRAAGASLVAATSSDDTRVRCLAYRAKGATVLWLANTGAGAFGIVLDETSFEQATTEPAAFQAGVKTLATAPMALRAYAVALVCINDR